MSSRRKRRSRGSRSSRLHFQTDFIAKEHDLLVRVVNERETLNEERRLFQRQRNGDIVRMREEAAHLESCLVQVEQANAALERSRGALEAKYRDIDDLHEQLVNYEAECWRDEA